MHHHPINNPVFFGANYGRSKQIRKSVYFYGQHATMPSLPRQIYMLGTSPRIQFVTSATKTLQKQSNIYSFFAHGHTTYGSISRSVFQFLLSAFIVLMSGFQTEPATLTCYLDWRPSPMYFGRSGANETINSSVESVLIQPEL